MDSAQSIPMAARRCAFPESARFDFVPALESACAEILAELQALSAEDFQASRDSLTTVANGYDETGWRAFELFGDAPECSSNRAKCPETTRACRNVPGMVHANFSLLRPGTHLYPHRGERVGVLRCHLALVVPSGDVALRAGGETRTWQVGRCLLFDDTVEHEAWNHGSGDRVVLIVTFEARERR